MYNQDKNGEAVALQEHIPDRNVLALKKEVNYICMRVKWHTNFKHDNQVCIFHVNAKSKEFTTQCQSSMKKSSKQNLTEIQHSEVYTSVPRIYSEL